MQFPLRPSFPQSYLTALLSNSFPYVYLLCGVLSLFTSILFYFIKLKESKRHLYSISLFPRAHKIQSLKFLRTQRSMCDNYWFSNPSVILVSYLEILVQQILVPVKHWHWAFGSQSCWPLLGLTKTCFSSPSWECRRLDVPASSELQRSRTLLASQ